MSVPLLRIVETHPQERSPEIQGINIERLTGTLSFYHLLPGFLRRLYTKVSYEDPTARDLRRFPDEEEDNSLVPVSQTKALLGGVHAESWEELRPLVVHSIVVIGFMLLSKVVGVFAYVFGFEPTVHGCETCMTLLLFWIWAIGAIFHIAGLCAKRMITTVRSLRPGEKTDET
jgi:hypothetical protein